MLGKSARSLKDSGCHGEETLAPPAASGGKVCDRSIGSHVASEVGWQVVVEDSR
jgi:hypothetical protein